MSRIGTQIVKLRQGSDYENMRNFSAAMTKVRRCHERMYDAADTIDDLVKDKAGLKKKLKKLRKSTKSDNAELVEDRDGYIDMQRFIFDYIRQNRIDLVTQLAIYEDHLKSIVKRAGVKT